MRPALRTIVYAAVCLALAVAVQSLRLGQAITGPAVNAALDIAAGVAGPLAGAAVGVFTPVFALLFGQLKAPMAPAVPFIAVANALMVVTFFLLLKRSGILAVVGSSIVKFAAMWLPTHFFLGQLLPPAVYKVASLMFTWPQLGTALVGGSIAVVILRDLERAGFRFPTKETR